MKKTYRFYKEPCGKWYIDLPDWEGEKEELEMVAGADTMLEIFAQDSTDIKVVIADESFEGATTMLSHLEDTEGGANYFLTSELFSFDVWLCDVTKHVFKRFPKTLHLQYAGSTY